jgi:hypothetical protein
VFRNVGLDAIAQPDELIERGNYIMDAFVYTWQVQFISDAIPEGVKVNNIRDNSGKLLLNEEVHHRLSDCSHIVIHSIFKLTVHSQRANSKKRGAGHFNNGLSH